MGRGRRLSLELVDSCARAHRPGPRTPHGQRRKVAGAGEGRRAFLDEARVEDAADVDAPRDHVLTCYPRNASQKRVWRTWRHPTFFLRTCFRARGNHSVLRRRRRRPETAGTASTGDHAARASPPYPGERVDVVRSRVPAVFVARKSCERGERSHWARGQMGAAHDRGVLTCYPPRAR